MISARGLTKRFGSTVAVDSLSFDVRPGAVTGFLGPNGSGKSTTMRMIMGLDAPDSGQATINGRRYPQLRWPLREAGAMLDAGGFQRGRSARSHLAALAASNSIARSRVDEVLGVVGLQDAARRRAGAFSLGIATALLGDPGECTGDDYERERSRLAGPGAARRAVRPARRHPDGMDQAAQPAVRLVDHGGRGRLDDRRGHPGTAL
jgi:ABC-2 type transport system ATP-binding protein